MSLATYLVARGKRGTWQLRVPIPRALHALGQPKERIKSMGTSDRRVASDRALRVLDEWKTEWAALLNPTTGIVVVEPSPVRLPEGHEMDAAAVELGYDLELADADTGRRTLAGKGPGIYRAHVAFVRAELEDQVQAAATSDDRLVRELAEEAMAALGVNLPHDSEAYIGLVERLNAARLANLQAQHKRNVGEVEAVGESSVINRVRQRELETAKPGETLVDLFDRYAEQRLAEGGKRQDTLIQDRKVIEQVSEFIGADRAVTSIKAEHIREYRDVMRQLPPKWRDRRDMRGLTMREAAKAARAANMARVTLTTVNKHLSTISPLFAWLIEERWDLTNPCNGLFSKRVKGRNPRPPFGTERLNAVLASTLFTGFEADGKEHLPGILRATDWRHWIPLLCLFTGMRVGEAAQLRSGDVAKHESGAWIIDIMHNPAKDQTTKSGQSRAAVAHAKLVELGFIAFVESRRKAKGDDRLFPELNRNTRAQIGAEPSSWLRDYLGRIGVKDGADGLGAHSFRHELADRLRMEVGLIDDQIAVVLGHDQKSTTAGYGSVRQGTVKFLAPIMEQVTFDGVDFEKIGTRAPSRTVSSC